MSQWSEFYKTRVNNPGYEIYFELKYRKMLERLSEFKTICDEGCGIGSISKALRRKNIYTRGIDICPDMVYLCHVNNPGMDVRTGDIFTHNAKADVVVTHGVLEHFPDTKIMSILDKYKAQNQRNMHYVPLIGHGEPSFGDERLLELEYWLGYNPRWYFTFNDDKDLVLFF